MDKLEVLVEYEIPKVRHLMIKCPSCKKYFYGADVLNESPIDKVDVEMLEGRISSYNNKFVCPVCGHIIVGNDGCKIVVKETSNFPNAMRKIVSWEE